MNRLLDVNFGMHFRGIFLIFAVFCFSAQVSTASSAGITYQGRILKPNGDPLEDSNVQFRLQLRSPDINNCLLYEETQALDLTGSKGVFGLTLNDGTGAPTVISIQDGAAAAASLPLERLLANRGTFTFSGGECVSGTTYTPDPADGRRVVVYFKDSTMVSWEAMPTTMVNYVPYAFEARSVLGFTASSLLRVQEADGTMGSVAPMTAANHTELMALIGGTSTQYEVPNKLRGVTVPAMTNTHVLGWSAGAWVSVDPAAGVQGFAKVALPACGAGEYLTPNGSGLLTCSTPANAGGTITSITAGTGLTGGTITASGTIALATVGSGATGVKITYDTYGRVVGSTASLVEGDIPTLTSPGKVSGNAITSGTIGGSTAFNSSGAITTSGTITTTSTLSAANATVTGTVTTTNVSASGTVAANILSGRSVYLYDPDGGPNKITFTADSALATDYTLKWPLTAGSGGYVLTTDGSGNLSWSSVGATGLTSLVGDVVTSGTGAASATIQANAVTTAKIAPLAVDTSRIASAAVTYGKIQNVGAGRILGNSTGGAATVEELSVGTGLYLSGGVLQASGLLSAVSNAANLALGKIWIGDGTGKAQEQSVTGDVALSITGVTVVNAVGGSASSAINSATILANAASSSNTASQIVRRDSTGSVAAASASLSAVILRDSGVNTAALRAPTTLTNSYILKLPTDLPVSNGQVLSSDTTGNLSWATVQTNTLANNMILVGNASGIAAPVAMSGDATIVASGAITLKNTGTAGTYSKVTTDAQGRVLSGVASLAIGDLPNTVLVNGGNTTGASMAIGANDAQTVKLVTSGLSRLAVTSSGGVGIGTTSPATLLDVAGTLKIGNGNETCTGAYAGGMRYASGALQYCDGSTWSALGVAGAGIAALTGDVAAAGSGSVTATIQPLAVTTSKIASSAVTYGKIQNVSGARILGNSASTAGVMEEITVGSGLSLSGGTLSASGLLAAITNSATLANAKIWIGDATGKAQEWLMSGDVTLSNSGSATVAYVGGSLASDVHAAELLANAATSISTNSAIVRRDVTGSFVSNIATLNGLALNNAGSVVNVVNPIGAAYTLTLPTALGSSGQVLATSGSGVLIWSTPLTTALAAGNIFVGNASGVATSVAMSSDATISSSGALTLKNTGSIGTYLKVTTDAQGRVASGVSTLSTADLPTTVLLNGGNTTGATMLIGASDSQRVQIISGGAAKLTVTSSGSVGIGTTSPVSALSVSGSMTLMGSTSGYTGFIASAAAGSTVWTLPTTDGSAGQQLTTNGAGVLTWAASGGGGGGGLTYFAESFITTSPNATVPVARLIPTGASANIDFSLAAKGTGAITAQVPDGTSAGGNKRGANALDFQISRLFATQVANGANSVILGGLQNETTNLATASFIGAGAQNTISGGSAGIVSGEQNSSQGSYAFVGAGYMNTASGVRSSVPGGMQNYAYGNDSFATGFHVTTDSFAQATFGAWNLPIGSNSLTTWQTSDPLFVIGNGTAGGGSRSNAVYVRKDGNVGIGTTAASGKLSVNGSMVLMGSTSGYSGFVASAAAGSSVWTLPTADGSSGQVLTTNGTGALNWASVVSSSTGFVNGGNTFGASGVLGTKDANTLSLMTNNTNRVSILSTGYVGINDPAPATRLSLGGLTSGHGLAFKGATANNDFTISAADNGASFYYEFKPGAAVNQPTMFYNATSTSTNGLGIRNNGGGYHYLNIYHNDTYAGLQTSSGVLALQPSGGKISLNTMSSPYSVNFAGDTGLTNGQFIVYHGTGSSSTVRLHQSSVTDWALTNTATTGDFAIAESGSERLRIGTTGKIGINQTGTINGQLDVKGTIVMSGATSGYTGFAASAAAGSTVWTLPAADGASGSSLVTNGAGVLTWSSGGGSGDFKSDGSVSMTGALKANPGAAGTPGYTFNGNTSTGFFQAASNTLSVATNGSEAFRVTASGYVGIGATTPSGFVDITKSAGAGAPGAALYLAPTLAASGPTSFYSISNTLTVGTPSTTAVGHYNRISGGSNMTNSYGINNGITQLMGNASNGYGLYSAVATTVSGSITNAYAVSAAVSAGGGGITNSYGLHVGTIQGTNKWSIYANDSSAPSFINGNLGLGTGNVAPTAKVDVNQQASGTLAFLAQASGTQYFKVVVPSNGLGVAYNAGSAVMFVGRDNTTGRSINAAGSVNVGGADFAEWVEWPVGVAKPKMGSIIKYKGTYVVVSSPQTAAFIGNDVRDPEHSILIAFVGQLPVLVRGVVREGDLIVGRGDGTGEAVSKDHITLEQSKNVVGTAWSSSINPGLKRVNVGVGMGLGGNGARDIASIKAQAEADKASQDQRIQSLERENAGMKVRLERLEKALLSK